MSYCVNCGVELDNTVKQCPLCDTVVINPRITDITKEDKNFPAKKGKVEEVSRRDVAILFSVVLVATSITCALLNFLVFNSSMWSFFVMGACLIVWVMFIPTLIYKKISPYTAIFLDGLSIGIYMFLISLATNQDAWFWGLALYITVFVTGVLEIFTLCVRKLPVTFLTVALEVFSAIGIICLGVEILIDNFVYGKINLMWSMIVVVVCVILDITLITMLSRKRIRNAVRKRFHF